MKTPAIALALLLALPAIAVTAQLPEGPGPHLGERVFVLVMENTRFNLRTWPDTPLLEAYAGENMRFIVHVPITAEPHTFHMHGHPWTDPATGDFIDTILLQPGESHDFQVTAGLEAGHAGDWLYHCHMEQHFGEGMWGLLRVHPYGLTAAGDAHAFTLEAWDADGRAVTIDDVTLTLDGAPVGVTPTRLTDARVALAPALPPRVTGTLVATTHGPLGESVIRLALDGSGGITPVRDVRPDVPLPDVPDSGDARSDPLPLTLDSVSTEAAQ